MRRQTYILSLGTLSVVDEMQDNLDDIHKRLEELEHSTDALGQYGESDMLGNLFGVIDASAGEFADVIRQARLRAKINLKQGGLDENQKGER
jgi:hypothetical protein